jgi:hypothetical protein
MNPTNNYSPTPVIISRLHTACSGPELAAYVPDPELARELAQTLIADQFDISEQCFAFGSSVQSPAIRLARKY